MGGQHLEALIGDRQKAIELLPSVFERAVQIPVLPEQIAADTEREGTRFRAFASPGAPASLLVLCRLNSDNNEVVGYYPFLRDGAPQVLEILDLNPDDDGTEGVIEAVNHNAVAVTFYDPTFACHRGVYAKGRKYEFSIAALAYSLENVENTTFRVTEGPMVEIERRRRLHEDPQTDVSTVTGVEFSMAELRALWPCENGGDAEFQTVVESVEYFDVEGSEVCKMNVILMRSDDEDFKALLYASEHVLKNYRPEVGDSIRGVLWLQGYPLRPVDDPVGWGDRLTAASPQYDMDGFERVLEMYDYLSDQHPGVVAVGAACAQNGWDVTKYNNPDRSPDMPSLYLERPGRKAVNVWVRAHIVGFEPAIPFSSQDLSAYRAASAKHDQDAAFVTVICTDIGKGYAMKGEGIETLEQYVGKIYFTDYVAKPTGEEGLMPC